ncbi:MAG: Ig-like domain-containing protein, partial [Spirochaetota bacterium]
MKRALYIIAALLLFFQSSCDKAEVWPRVNSDDVPGMDSLAVLSTTPTHGQTGVPVSATISIQFSDNINDATIINGTTLLLNGGPVGGFSYDNISRILEITTGGLSSDTVYTVRLTTGIET